MYDFDITASAISVELRYRIPLRSGLEHRSLSAHRYS